MAHFNRLNPPGLETPTAAPAIADLRAAARGGLDAAAASRSGAPRSTAMNVTAGQPGTLPGSEPGGAAAT